MKVSKVKGSLVLILLSTFLLAVSGNTNGQSFHSSTEDILRELEGLDTKDTLFGETSYNLALSYKSEGYFTRAKQSFLAGITNYEEQNMADSEEFAFMLADLGGLYWEKGELAIARDLYSDSESLLSKIPGAKSSEKFKDLKLNLGIANAKLGDQLSAMVSFNNVRTLYERESQDIQARTIAIVIKIAEVYTEIENLQKAASLYDEAKDQLSRLEAPEENLNVSLLLNQAKYFEKVGEISKAINNHMLALEIYAKNDLIQSLEYGDALSSLGHLYLQNGQHSEALQTLLKASEIQEKMAGSYHSKFLKTQTSLANLYRFSGQFEVAKTIYESVLDEWLKQYSMMYGIMGIQEKTNYYLTISALIEMYASLAEVYGPNADLLNSRLLDFKMMIEHLHMTQYSQEFTSDQHDQIGLWDMKERQLYLYKQPISEINGGPSVFEKYVNQVQNAEKKLVKKESPGISHDFESWIKTKETLASNQAAVVVIRYQFYDSTDIDTPSNDVHYSFLSFDSESKLPSATQLKYGNEMENRYLTHYRNSINHKFSDEYAYDIYWQPVKSQLNKYDSILLTPAGAYRQINLLTLKNMETGKYLIDEMRIDLTSSISSRNATDQPRKEDPEVYIFGNADYHLGKPNQNQERIADYNVYTSPQAESGMYYMRDKVKQQILWNELLYVDEVKVHEVELLDNLYSSAGYTTHTFTNDSALESEVKSLVKPNTLHITTHGYFMENDDLNTNGYFDNQLLQSGLIFSGCFDYLDQVTDVYSQNDGLLTTLEIANLDLENTELVFLSSCETGIGVVQNGNAITSFQHAFMEAGSDAMIMTLWTTEAEYELEFMNLFYYYWLFNNSSKSEAYLKSAQMMRESYENPYYWGAFVYIGE